MARDPHNGNGQHVSISTLVQTKYNGGDIQGTLSQLLSRRPSGTLTIHLSQGGIVGLELVERTPSPTKILHPPSEKP